MVRGRWIFLALFVNLSLCAQQEHWQQLNNQVLILNQQGKYAEAVPVAQEALRVAEATFSPDDFKIGTSLNNLALLYKHEGKYALAEPLYQRTLQIWEIALGSEHPGVAIALNNLAVLYVEEGKYALAEPLCKRALQLREKVLGLEHLDVSQSLYNLAVLYRMEGKYALAEPLYQRALQIYEKALGPDHPDIARVLNSMALLYDSEGKYALAESTSRRALKIREKALGPDHLDVAEALNNLAQMYDNEGKYAQSEPLYQRALQIYEKALGPNHPYIATVLNNLALLYLKEGKYTQAESLSRRVLHIREKALGPEHPDVASALNSLAGLYDEQGQYSLAEPLFQRALQIWDKALGPNHPDVALSLNNLASLYREEGKYAQAEPLYQRALQIFEKARGLEHQDVGTALNNLAGLYKEEGKYVKAEPLYQRALQIFEKALGPEHSNVATTLANLAGLRVAQGQPEQAQPLYTRAFDNLFRQFERHFDYMSEKERLGFLATVSYRFSLYLSFVHQFEEKKPDLAGSMYDLLLWEKGLIAGSESALRRQVASGDAETSKLLDQLSQKRTQIAALFNAHPKDREIWRKQTEQLETESNDLERALVARSSAFAQQEKLERATWQQVRDALKPREAAVEFARFRFYDGKKWTGAAYCIALVITHETTDYPAYVVLGDDKQLEGASLVAFQRSVQDDGSEASPEADAQHVRPAARAYDLFWKPLEPLLSGVIRVYLSPDGVLNKMPMGLVAAADGKLLMEKYDLRLLSSTKDLLRESTPSKNNTAVLVGNPAFDLSETQQRTALEKLGWPQYKSEQVAAREQIVRSRDQLADDKLKQLPGSGDEVQAIGDLLLRQDWQVATYMRDRALEEVVKQVHGPRLLHLATHGFFFPDQQIKADQFGTDKPTGLEDPMLRSGLYFAGANRVLAGQTSSSDLDDGLLSAYEAASLNLQGTELVVLSACNTGQGDMKNGEGIFGLHRALKEAGAQAVMMSLWSVPDKETQELMIVFYSHWLGGMEKHEALRNAQLEMRKRVMQHYGRDLAYYWGAFVLVGR